MENKIFRNMVNGMLYKLLNGWVMVKDCRGNSTCKVWSVSQVSSSDPAINESNFANWIAEGYFVETTDRD